jgi:hypothetical protein
MGAVIPLPLKTYGLGWSMRLLDGALLRLDHFDQLLCLGALVGRIGDGLPHGVCRMRRWGTSSPEPGQCEAGVCYPGL